MLILQQHSAFLWANTGIYISLSVKVRPVFKLLTISMEEWGNSLWIRINFFFPFYFFLLYTYLLPFLFISYSSLFSSHSFDQAHYVQRLCWPVVSDLCYLNHKQVTTHSMVNSFNCAIVDLLPYISYFSKKDGYKHINQ